MTTSSAAHTWITRFLPNPDAKLRLFCFPYAGGGSVIYHPWANHLPNTIEVCALKLPGRENRLSEIPFTRMGPLVRVLADVLLPYFDRPFVFFGHSLGGLISFELTQTLRLQQRPVPQHLYVSGVRAPDVPRSTPPMHQLPTPHFIDRLREINGTPEVILNNASFMQVLLPCLRADFALSETYNYLPQKPLDCPITAFGGLTDTLVSQDALDKWKHHTTQAFNRLMFSGGHFFLNTDRATLLTALTQELSPYLTSHGSTGR